MPYLKKGASRLSGLRKLGLILALMVLPACQPASADPRPWTVGCQDLMGDWALYEAPSSRSIRLTEDGFRIVYADGSLLYHKATYGATCALIPGALPPPAAPTPLPGIFN